MTRRRLNMHLPKGEEGQALSEYGLTIVLVAILIIVVVALLGTAHYGLWQRAWEKLEEVFAPSSAIMMLPLRLIAAQFGFYF
jgi:Flp pilus assembly pilin Flp